MVNLLLALLLAQPAQSLTIDEAKQRIAALIAASGAEVAVAYQPLQPGAPGILIDADKTFHAASTMKVPVMIEAFRQAEHGGRTLDTPIRVTNTFKSIVDGSPYQLSATEDSDGEVYKAIGKTMTMRQLVTASIIVSSNLATNILIEELGAENVRRTVAELGGDGMVVLRGVEDQKAFDKGLNNATTARALMMLLGKIARGEAVSRAASLEMSGILNMQEFNDGIPAGLPEGIRVGHKTGSITRINHDAAIVHAEQPYLLVVLTRGIEDGKKSSALIAEISRVIYSTRRSNR